MYIGLDFLLSDKKKIYLSEVNIGLPGGAFEYDIAHKTVFGKASGVFEKIERVSEKFHMKSFRDYIHTMPFIEELKEFKLFMDRLRPIPSKLHPVLRLEDKWIQYQLLNEKFLMPYTEIFNPSDSKQIESFQNKFKKIALKKRTGRWGKGFEVIEDVKFSEAVREIPYLIQEYIVSKVGNYLLSIRAVSFEGEFICMSGDISESHDSKWRYVIFIEEGEKISLRDDSFEIIDIEGISWEGKIWYNGNIPEHQKLNLIGDKVANTILYLPQEIISEIKKLSEEIGKIYMNLDFSKLPEAWFEE